MPPAACISTQSYNILPSLRVLYLPPTPPLPVPFFSYFSWSGYPVLEAFVLYCTVLQCFFSPLGSLLNAKAGKPIDRQLTPGVVILPVLQHVLGLDNAASKPCGCFDSSGFVFFLVQRLFVFSCFARSIDRLDRLDRFDRCSSVRSLFSPFAARSTPPPPFLIFHGRPMLFEVYDISPHLDADRLSGSSLVMTLQVESGEGVAENKVRDKFFHTR